MEALSKGNGIRLAQAALRRELSSKPRPESQEQLAEIIRETTEDAYLRARVTYLIASVRRRGPSIAFNLLRKLGIDSESRLDDLTERERQMLASALVVPLGDVVTTTQHGFVRIAA